MSKSDNVRTTRDGDQFHYLWAARKSLQLLAPNTDLLAISVEGASSDEMSAGDEIEQGEEVIDVAEYHGGTDLASAKFVRYIQLKHSTLHAQKPWSMSGFSKTLKGFAKRYKELLTIIPPGDVAGKISFAFVTNRPINANVQNAIEDARANAAPRNEVASRGLKKYTELTGTDLASFCALFHLEAEQEGFLAQRKALSSDLRGYLPGGDHEAFLGLKELVTRKASSEFEGNPNITKVDLYRVFGIDDEALFPAKNEIALPNIVVPRVGEQDWVNAIINAGSNPVVVHAEGGIGKSVFAQRIGLYLPSGSVSIVYDCFGNGQYRAPSSPRHGARQALVQIANELAASEYCLPMVATVYADDVDYFRAFAKRVEQAAAHIRSLHSTAVLCIVIDAADNAEMAAEESGDSPSFTRKLIKESLPEGVRLVMLCRTYRCDLLSPPPGYVDLPLPAFNRDETAAKLTGVYPLATPQDVEEFHRLTSQNPRVQSIALESGGAIQLMLRNLGPEPKTAEDMIGRLLDQAIARAKVEIPSTQQASFERICIALALFRPLIPISVISSLVDLGQSLRAHASNLVNNQGVA